MAFEIFGFKIERKSEEQPNARIPAFALPENEDGSKAFHSADAENLQRFLPESVLNDLELFMMDIQVDIDTAKNESSEITG